MESSHKTQSASHRAEIYYYDIGDYLSRDDKLRIIQEFHDISRLPMVRITPNEHGDWISQRNDRFGTWIAIGDKDDKANKNTFFVPAYSRGLATARDSWCYCFSEEQLEKQIRMSIDFYNEQRTLFHLEKLKNPNSDVHSFVCFDDSKLSWNRGILNYCAKNKKISFDEESMRMSLYRPFCKENGYFNVAMNDMTYQLDKIFPSPAHKNLVICTSSVGDKNFSVIITDCIPDLHLNATTQCFPLYWYEEMKPEQGGLFTEDGTKYVRHEAVTDFILGRARNKYGSKVGKEDTFYYVYGLLHSPSYRTEFEADLKKMLPRIPLVSDSKAFWAFSKSGRELAALHLGYEDVAPCPDVKVESLPDARYKAVLSAYEPGNGLMVAAGNDSTQSNSGDDFSSYDYYAVQQMKFPKKGEKGTIVYNHWHTVTDIPSKAYEYVVNGKSAIEWIMERYAVTTDKKSGIVNNPNDWSREHEKPRYILDLLLSIINVSVQTVDIVNSLPDVDWEKE